MLQHDKHCLAALMLLMTHTHRQYGVASGIVAQAADASQPDIDKSAGKHKKSASMLLQCEVAAWRRAALHHSTELAAPQVIAP